ncbi:alpha/beta hydrolase [Stutzerimonas nosocomialis]|uniref:alpha/beta hydrolase n=1 Tax=Stutzerimonas nosocomialis TaxID=1056496 RepID=UPI0011092485|nr:alpha/beta hydrolase-fold protein [Stutzerimonas nosocomialis]TLX56458.1 alpha/beta hydrolase [Stutzerimonas nosocomialis]
MKRALLTLLATLPACLAAAHAAEPTWRPVTLPQAEQKDIHSRQTGRDYRIFLSQPRGEAPPGGYPVLYVLDGNALFPGLAVQAAALAGRPDAGLRDSVLVVGIGYPGDALYDLDARAYDYTPAVPEAQDERHGGAERFLAFLETELKPLVAARYPIDPQRQTLFGHSYGGLFALYTLFRHPDAFQGYVSASPSIWWGDGYLLDARDRFLAAAGEQAPSARLLLTVGGAEEPTGVAPDDPRGRRLAERRMVGNARELAQSLAPLQAHGLASELRVHPEADHGTNGWLTAIEALTFAARPVAQRPPSRP